MHFPFNSQLVLKHRQGKNHKMRIVVFVGSPLESEEGDLVKLAKKLKKEKVNVDIVSFGDHTGNNELLSAFINALNGKDGTGSHLVSVPRGSVLSEALITSPIIQGEDGQGGAGLGGAGFEFGVDPNEDPELALVRNSFERFRFFFFFLKYFGFGLIVCVYFLNRPCAYRWKSNVNVKRTSNVVHWPNQIQPVPVARLLERPPLFLSQPLKRPCFNVHWPYQLRLR